MQRSRTNDDVSIIFNNKADNLNTKDTRVTKKINPEDVIAILRASQENKADSFILTKDTPIKAIEDILKQQKDTNTVSIPALFGQND